MNTPVAITNNGGGFLSPRNVASASLANIRDNAGIFSLPISPRGELLGPVEIKNNGNQLLLGSRSDQRFVLRNSSNNLPSVSEVVNKNSDFGINGYTLPHFNAALDKPVVYRFSPTKQRQTFIDFAVKQKEFMPGSTRYNTTRELLNPKKGLLTTKSKRKMLSEDIEDFAKKFKKPDPGTYEIKNK